MISLVFIRHGATSGNLEKRYIGRTDEPLSETGISQALKLRDCNLPKEYIFVSPMKRALETAKLIFPENGYVIEEDLKETDFGIFEGKTALELSENEEYRVWVESMCTLPVPGGESITEFKTRCVSAFERIVKTLPDESEASFVVHGGVIMAIMEEYAEEKGSFYDYHIKNGEVLSCKFEDGRIKI